MTASRRRQNRSVGCLVGEEHKGLFLYMFAMNEARIGVDSLATAIGYGYLQSLEYAKTRVQGPSRRLEGSRVQASGDHRTSRRQRMLLAQKSYVEGGLALGLWSSTLVDRAATATDDDERARAALLLDVITPISKSWLSQWCLTANDLAIQVLGGYGYTSEFDVEQCYRDNRLNPHSRGHARCSGHRPLGRKFTMKGGAGLRALVETITETIERATAGGDAAGYAATLRASADRIPCHRQHRVGRWRSCRRPPTPPRSWRPHRTHRPGLAVAGTIPCRRGQRRRFLRRQASRDAILLQVRAAQDGTDKRSGGRGRPHHHLDASPDWF